MSWLVSWWLLLAPVCWAPPVSGPAVEPYRAPACTYCPGHRGVTFGSTPGEPVRAVAAGVVQFAGPVAGIEWVVVRGADRLIMTYGQLADRVVTAGQQVSAGQVIGRAGRLVYFGVRLDGHPVDPTAWLGRWRSAPRLVPLDRWPRRPGTDPRLSCGAR
jgi:murein DD-endopeptidase MepM/ murein hydrolase activator NlpD